MSEKISAKITSIERKADFSSLIHMDAARCFAFGSHKIGKYYDEHPQDGRSPRKRAVYRAYVVGALYTSVAFVEAAINEVFLDAERNTRIRNLDKTMVPRYTVQGLRPDVVELMARVWLQQQKYRSWPGRNRFEKHLDVKNPKNNIDFWRTLDKYQLALGLNKKRPIGKSNKKKETISTLIDFRNYLTHAKTEWVIANALKRKRQGTSFGVHKPEKEETVKRERQIKALIKSDKNRPREGYPHEKFIMEYFPYNCLTANLAKIAVKSSLEFYNEFSRRMGMLDIEAQHPILRGTLSRISSL